MSNLKLSTYISEEDMSDMPESKIRGITFHKMQE